MSNCNCNCLPNPCITPAPTPCSQVGCFVELDSACIFYHKDTNDSSELTNLALENGATLEDILHAIDAKLGVLNRFRGNVASNPATLSDGDYWWRTDLAVGNALKIYVNGGVRTIPTTA